MQTVCTARNEGGGGGGGKIKNKPKLLSGSPRGGGLGAKHPGWEGQKGLWGRQAFCSAKTKKKGGPWGRGKGGSGGPGLAIKKNPRRGQDVPNKPGVGTFHGGGGTLKKLGGIFHFFPPKTPIFL